MGKILPRPTPSSPELENAVEAVVELIRSEGTPVFWGGVEIARFNLRDEFQQAEELRRIYCLLPIPDFRLPIPYSLFPIRTMVFDEKFLQLGDELPPLPQLPPNLEFVLWRKTGNLYFSAGHAPQWGSEFRYLGKVGRDLTVAEGVAAARLTTLNLLQSLRQTLGSLDKVIGVIDLFGVVNSASNFTQQSEVINGCSQCLVEIFSDAGRHSRMAIGVPELPFNIAVEIKLVVEVSDT